MSKKISMKPVAVVLGAMVAGSVASTAAASANPFGIVDMPSGYMQLAAAHQAEGKCGAGKCGGEKSTSEGKCGAGKCGGEKKKSDCDGKRAEGKCGAGKCGGEKSTSEGKCGAGKCGGAK